MATIYAQRSRSWIALTIVPIIAGATATGCQPQGAGSITIGDLGQRRKPPVALEKKAPAKPGRTTDQDNPPVYKSINEQIREVDRRPGSRRMSNPLFWTIMI